MRALSSDTTDLTDNELIRLISLGKEAAYYELFERHWERLYGISVGVTKDEEIAKDVVQEVMLSIWNRRESLNVVRAEAYLARAAKLQALKTLRDSHSERFESLFNIHVPEAPEETLEFEELQSSINGALDELSDRCKEVFLMSREEQLSNAEIAQRLNISQRTVETHISNALRHLKSKLLVLFWIFLSGNQ